MIKKFQLKNGLTSLMIKNTQSPVVSVQMWVHTGSADETKGLEGISHFIEHLVFKGSKKYGVGEIAKIVEGSGGQLNAYTSFDQTVFYVTISKHFKEVALDTISQMMGFPLFKDEEIDKEREVVIEEIKRTKDNPGRQASYQLFETVYKQHPYRVPVIGFEENIKNITRAQIMNYYDSRYVPENMTLLVAGDFDEKEMKLSIKKYFNDFKNFKLKKIKRSKEVSQLRAKINVKKSNFEENQIFISWRTPQADHKDVLPLEVLALILGQGDSSRLMKKLRIEKPLTNYTAASTFTPKDQGFFTISSSLILKNFEEILTVLHNELIKILEQPVSEEEINKAIINFESDKFYALQTVDGITGTYGHFEHVYGDYKKFNEFIGDAKKITAHELLRVARKYLKPEKLNISMMVQGHADDYKKQLSKWVAKYRKSYRLAAANRFKIVASPKKKNIRWVQKVKKSEFKLFKLSTGGTLVIKNDFEAPVISIKTGFLSGSRNESISGTVDLLSKTWASHSKNFNEQFINNQFEKTASRISAFGGRNTVGLSLLTLSPFRKENFKIYNDLLIEPRFSGTTLEREKVFQIERLKKEKDNPARICLKAFNKNIFPGHPYGNDISGTEESIAKINEKTLSSFYNQFAVGSNAYTAVCGQIDPDECFEMISESHKFLGRHDFSMTNRPGKKITDDVFLFNHLDKAQSHIIVGYQGITIGSEKRFALEIMQSVLAGQGGRLFIELRDKKSLAYSISPIRLDGLDAGYFGGYIACSPEKTNTAIEMLMVEFEKIASDGISAEEFKSAKRNLIGRHDIGLQKASSQNSSILFDVIYNIPYDETFKFKEKIEAVTLNEIKEVAQEIFSQNKVISVVGKNDPF